MPRDKIGHFYYSWYPTIYQADTQALTLAEDGAYRRLIDHYMLTRTPLLDDDRALARAVGVGIDDWELVKVRVKQYFKPTRLPDGVSTAYLKHDFCDEAIAFDNARIEKARKNGKKGGKIRSSKTKEITHPVTQPSTEPSSLPELTITEQIKKVSIEGFALTSDPAPLENLKSKKGTRLPDDWELEQEWGDWAIAEGLTEDDVLLHEKKFKNHWLSTTKNPTKRNWRATWENWVISSIERKNNEIPQKRFK